MKVIVTVCVLATLLMIPYLVEASNTLELRGAVEDNGYVTGTIMARHLNGDYPFGIEGYGVISAQNTQVNYRNSGVTVGPLVRGTDDSYLYVGTFGAGVNALDPNKVGYAPSLVACTGSYLDPVILSLDARGYFGPDSGDDFGYGKLKATLDISEVDGATFYIGAEDEISLQQGRQESINYLGPILGVRREDVSLEAAWMGWTNGGGEDRVTATLSFFF